MRRTLLRAALGSRWRLGLATAAGLALTLISALVAAVAPAQAAATCAVNYVIRDQWSAGFTADVTITNHGAAINSWTLGFSFPGDQKVTNGWNATWSQTGQDVTAKNASWNGSLATGGSTTIGFNGSYSGTNAKPASFTLNGAACAPG